MSSIHYFQRYSQPENVATNNTLLLLSRLYQHSPNKFRGFLNELLDDTDLEAGILFNQQEKGKGSVPDANLTQISFKVVIETKLHQNFSVAQLTAHLDSFKGEEYKILLSLSPKIPSEQTRVDIIDEIQKFNSKNNVSVKYIPTTFQKIVQIFNDTIEDYDSDLIQIIDDYESYCLSDKLITSDDHRMRAVTCGWTIKENIQYSLYYDRVSRGYSDHSYIGIYNNKSIHGLGKIENIIEADLLTNGTLNIKHSAAKPSQQQIQNIIQVIAVAKQNNNWDITKDHNFFCVDKFWPTDFKKLTKYPLQGTKFFNLKTELGLKDLPTTDKIANLLRTKTW